MSSKKVPIVAIVGRANVGKSSLFNSVLRRREAIVADEPGTTRDSVMGKASWANHDFWLVDTAGMKDPDDDFEFTIQEQITQATDSADVILVVVEANIPVSDDDRRVAKLALRSGKPVVLVANKADILKKAESIDHFQRLGIKPMFATSTTQRTGIDELLDELVGMLPKASIREDQNRIHVALLGRPNVGKSALFNALAKKQQAIVADRAGTTRDVNRATVRYEGREIELMDTAGIRRSGKIERGVERFSVIRALSAIEQSDVALLLIDANELAVGLDQKIGGLVKEAGKGLVIVVSKWDSVDKDAYTHDVLTPKIKAEFDFTPWAPLIFTSAVTGQNVTKLFELVLQIDGTRKMKIKTGDLNRWLQRVTDKHPPAAFKGKHPNLNFMVQETDQDTPTFQIHGSHARLLHWSYRRYLERELRETFGFEGTAIKIWLKENSGSRR